MLLLYRDRFRTAVNVLGDSMGAGIVDHYSKNELGKAPEYDLEETDYEASAEKNGKVNNGYKPAMAEAMAEDSKL